MADNVTIPATGSGDATPKVAADEATYSGDTAKIQVVRLVHVAGAEGAKTVSELVKAEDAAHSSGDPGVMLLAVRQDAAAALATTDGDYIPLIVDANGRLHVAVGSSALPTGASTSAKQDTVIGHLDGVEGLLTTIDADTGTLAGAVSGSEVQVDIVGALPAGTATVGAVNVKPATAGGLLIARDLDLDETELEIKASAGQLFGWFIYNDGAAEVYVKLYNATAANVSVGSTTPVMTIAIPAGSAANVEFTNGIEFGTAICAAATTGVADADTTAPAANQVVANFLYK